MKQSHYALDHIGIAVKNLDKSIAQYERNFGFTLHSRETIETSNVELAFLSLPNTLIELLTPTSTASSIHKFLETRGEGLHHVCYEVEDIRAELARMKSLGHRLIDETPRPGAHHSEIAFVHPKDTGGVLTEFCQYPS